MNLGFQEIVVVALVALLVVGPERLPELARQAGKLIGRFREETSKTLGELKRAAEMEDLDRELKAMREDLRAAGRELTHPMALQAPSPARPRRREQPPPTDPDAT